MAVAVDIGTLIESSPDIRHGRPRIAGTGITVHRIAVWYQMGETPDEIAAEMPHLSLAQVHAALAYYFANKSRIDQDLAEEQAEETSIERGYLARKNQPA